MPNKSLCKNFNNLNIKKQALSHYVSALITQFVSIFFIQFIHFVHLFQHQ